MVFTESGFGEGQEQADHHLRPGMVVLRFDTQTGAKQRLVIRDIARGTVMFDILNEAGEVVGSEGGSVAALADLEIESS